MEDFIVLLNWMSGNEDEDIGSWIGDGTKTGVGEGSKWEFSFFILFIIVL